MYKWACVIVIPKEGECIEDYNPSRFHAYRKERWVGNLCQCHCKRRKSITSRSISDNECDMAQTELMNVWPAKRFPASVSTSWCAEISIMTVEDVRSERTRGRFPVLLPTDSSSSVRLLRLLFILDKLKQISYKVNCLINIAANMHNYQSIQNRCILIRIYRV